MNTELMARGVAIAALLGVAATLGGCGRMGELEPPSARETERAPRDAGAPDLIEPATVNRPPIELPIDGAPSNPFGGSGAYPQEPPGG